MSKRRGLGGAAMAAGAGGTSILEILDDHTATTTESTYTYTPGTALNISTYAEIIVLYSLEASADFNLQMRINGVSTGSYFTRSQTHAGGSWTGTTINSATQMQIGAPTLMTGAQSITGRVCIYMEDGGFNDVNAIGCMMNEQTLVTDYNSNSLTTNTDEITSIETRTSTSTWVSGSRITTVGVRRIT